MPFCWIAQAESFKNIPGSVDFKTHTRGLMLQKSGKCLNMYETLLNNGLYMVGVLPNIGKLVDFVKVSTF